MPTRRKSLVITAALAVLLTSAATVIALHSQPPNGRRQPVTAIQLTPRSPRDHASTPPQARETEPPVPAAIDVTGLRWAGFHGIALPASPRTAPATPAAAWRPGSPTLPPGHCWRPSTSRSDRRPVGPAVYAPTITRQVTGPDQAALLHNQAAAYGQLQASARVRPGQPVGRGYAVVAAYRLAAYAPAGATVDVVTASPGTDGTTVLAATRIEVIWRRGDWRVVAPAGGDWANAATAISSLTGYRIFPGEG